MTFDQDYLRAKSALRAINSSKITPAAAARCAAHTLADQLVQLRTIHAVELALLHKRQDQDQSDIVAAFDADQLPPPARNRNAKGWDVQ